MKTTLPTDTSTHVLADKPLSEKTRLALITLVEVAYAAAQKGILPDESHYPDNYNGRATHPLRNA
jgi:hypothetical protein